MPCSSAAAFGTEKVVVRSAMEKSAPTRNGGGERARAGRRTRGIAYSKRSCRARRRQPNRHDWRRRLAAAEEEKGEEPNGATERAAKKKKKKDEPKTRQTASPISAQLKYSARGRRDLYSSSCYVASPTSRRNRRHHRCGRPRHGSVFFVSFFFFPSFFPLPDGSAQLRARATAVVAAAAAVVSHPVCRTATTTQCGRGFYPTKRVRPPPRTITARRRWRRRRRWQRRRRRRGGHFD